MVESNGEKGKSEGDHHHQQQQGGGAGERALKKGPWTAAEDGILIEYVKKHGEGNWNAVQKHTGLARCGKSCRLRWANHLRPNLKKGSFSQEEERVIIELHAKLGNKWARMAAQLPGRTDNEIKNYWNTRMKRRQRAGLPLYPLEIQQEATAFHLRQHHHHHQQQQPHHHSSSAAAAATNFSALRQKPDFNNNNPNSVSIFNFSSTINNPQKNFSDGSSFYATPTSQFKFFPENNSGGGFALPLSPVSPFPQIGQQINQSLSPQPPQGALQFSYGSYMCNSNSGLNSMILGAPYHHLIPGLETELPSIQTPPHSTTPASSGTSGGDGIMAAANSGLLDVVLLEAEARSRNGKHSKEESSSGGELKRTVEGSTEEEDVNLYVESVLGSSGGEAAAAGENHSDEFSSSHSSSRKRQRMEPLEEMDSMDDDDLMSLLNNFQSGMPVPEWYPSSGDDNLGINTHNGPSLCESNGNLEGDEQRHNITSPSTIASPVLEWSLGSSCWNNMPSIC